MGCLSSKSSVKPMPIPDMIFEYKGCIKIKKRRPDLYYECQHYKLRLCISTPRAGKELYSLSKMCEGDDSLMILDEEDDIVFKYNQVEKYWEYEIVKLKWDPEEKKFYKFIPEHPDCYRIEIENKIGDLKLIRNPLQ